MGEESKQLFGPSDKLYFCDYDSLNFNELPIVKNIVKLERPNEKPLMLTQSTFDIAWDNPDALLYLILERANKMLESIKEDIAMFYSFNPPRNRKERRARAKALKQRIEVFKSYCKIHNIEIKSAK